MYALKFDEIVKQASASDHPYDEFMEAIWHLLWRQRWSLISLAKELEVRPTSETYIWPSMRTYLPE